MSKFKVSLAVLIPQNYEIEIIAKTKKEAIAKAIEEFEESGSGIYVEKIRSN